MTEQNFEEIVASNEIVLIDFWAAWCGPCRSFAPTYEKVAGKYPDIVFAKVDTEVEQGLAATFNIMSIPTLMIIRENVVIFSQAGALPERALDELVEKVRDLDMQEVHRQVLEQQNANS
jgi:thioredoxin 1